MNTVIASSAAEWRSWLERHAGSETEAWLVMYHKGSGIPTVSYAEAVEQALCFGWIDGLRRKRDAASSQLRFTPRRPRSSWSAPNRQRVAKMIELGLMTEQGQAAIDAAKTNGTWQVHTDEP